MNGTETSQLLAENLALHREVATLRLRLNQAESQHRMVCKIAADVLNQRADLAQQINDATFAPAPLL